MQKEDVTKGLRKNNPSSQKKHRIMEYSTHLFGNLK